MLESLPHPTQDLEAAVEFTPEWHRQQEEAEREWLDAHIRNHVRQQRQLPSLILVHPAA